MRTRRDNGCIIEILAYLAPQRRLDSSNTSQRRTEPVGRVRDVDHRVHHCVVGLVADVATQETSHYKEAGLRLFARYSRKSYKSNGQASRSRVTLDISGFQSPLRLNFDTALNAVARDCASSI